MKKLGKRLFIVVVIGVVLYAAYFLFARPTGFTDRRTLIESYITNISSDSVCETHFNPETQTFCQDFSALFDGQTVTIESLSATGQVVNLTLAIDDNSDRFTVTFVTENVSGIRGIIHNQYYLIDIIE